MLKNLYSNYLLKYPKLFFTIIISFMIVMATFALKLEIDASAETLLLKNDKDLSFNREVAKRFNAPDFLVVTYSINDDLLSQKNINNIKILSNQLKKLESVSSINSIVTVPLLQSPVRPLKELLVKIPTLESKGIDKKLAKKEFLNSAIYKENLVSDDFKTTAILVNLTSDLIDKSNFTKKEKKRSRDIQREKNHNQILKFRKILSEFESQHPEVKLHLGGVRMIADDMVEFVKYDLKTFGLLIVSLLIIILYILFREIKWVIIPLFISTISIIITSGFFGFFGWEITVISSNFISLQLIMNISLVIHLIIKYKELNNLKPLYSQKELVTQSSLSMAKPSFFVVVTTIAGFSSLVFSGIVPIEDFGLMMSVGIIVSLVITFLLFPLVLLNLNKAKPKSNNNKTLSFTSKIADIAINYQKTILFFAFIVVIFSITGASKLRVENSFIDYFKQNTQIYQGMKLIDQKLGGTTPLDIILTFKEDSDEIKSVEIQEESEEFDEFDDEFEETQEDKEQYWLTPSKMEKIKQIHDYLDSLKPIGKVLSLATMGEIGKLLNNNKELDSLTLALMNNQLPEKYKRIIISPFLDVKNNMVRISTRVIDSQPNLKRDQLIKKIKKDLGKMINPKYEEIRVSNLLVIYNNMLQSLFNSQIKTIGIVIIILFIMFLILFKSFKMAIIAIIANTIPVGVIFGVMGWLNIPLDMMTITIAAISIGIAVDDTIHYIHRYTQEYKSHGNIIDSIHNAHKSIGTAMFYTSTIIMVGFSILVLSNFIPTIYFGLLTMIAMGSAIIADLLLLPVLLILFGKIK